MRSVITFSLHSASISPILEPSPQGLISSYKYKFLGSFQSLNIQEIPNTSLSHPDNSYKTMTGYLHNNVFFVTVFSVLLLGLQQGHKWVNWMKRKKSLPHKQHVWGFFKVKRRAKNLKHFSSDRQKPLKRSTFFFCLIAIHT